VPDALPSIEEIVQDLEKNTKTAKKEAPPITDQIVDNATAHLDEAPVEEVVEEKVAVPEKKDPLAAKFAALSRREKESRERHQDIERRLAEADRIRAENEARAAKLEERERALTTAKRPLDILKAHGISYADVTQDMVGNYQEPETDPIDTKLSERLSPINTENNALKERLAKAEEALAAIQAERVETAKRDVVSAIQRTAEENGCEMIAHVGEEAITLVQHVIRNYWDTHKKVLSYKEACDKVEEYYIDRVSKLADTPKMKSRLAPPPPVPTKPATKSRDASERPNTLTQSLTQGQRASRPNIDQMPKHEALALLATQLQFK
jgi:hypothetical protein